MVSLITSVDFKRFGSSVKEIRTNARFTQKCVSELSGINIDTIRRIENGFVIPKYETLALLSTIYKFDLTKLLIKTRDENELNTLYSRFDKVIVSMSDNRNENLAELNCLINDINLNNQLEHGEINLLKKFITSTTYMQSNNSYDHNSFIEELVNSLKLTIIDFRLENLSIFCYSELEIRVLLLIGIIYKAKGEVGNSIPIFEFCLNYLLLTTGDNELNSIKMKIKLYYNLSYAYFKIENDSQSLKYSEIGVKLCLDYKTHYCLEMLLARKAVAEFYLKSSNYLKTFKDAIYLLYAIGEHEQIDYLVNMTKVKHGIDLSIIKAQLYT